MQLGFTPLVDNLAQLDLRLFAVCSAHLGPAVSARSPAHSDFVMSSFDSSKLDSLISLRQLARMGFPLLVPGISRPEFLLLVYDAPQVGSLASLQSFSRTELFPSMSDLSDLDFTSSLHSSAHLAFSAPSSGVANLDSSLPALDFAHTDLLVSPHSFSHMNLAAFVFDSGHFGSAPSARGLVCLGLFLLVFNAIKFEKTEILSVTQQMHLESFLLLQSWGHFGSFMFLFNYANMESFLSLHSLARVGLAASVSGMA